MPLPFLRLVVGIGVLLLPAVVARADATAAMNSSAETYVKLALAAGVHDADFVDAYNGPPEWKSAVETAKLPLAEVRRQVQALGASLAALDSAGWDEMSRLRREYLAKQLRAMDARLALVEGHQRPFDEESALLFDAVAPNHGLAHFDALLIELEKALPGEGSLATRYQAFRNQFIIPSAKLDAVFTAAINEARARTRRHIALPEEESFTVEYVTGQPWGGYNWYKGGYHSLIQVNTDLPIFIDRAIDLAAHEGYPGHHVYNALLEKNLLRGRGWVEFSVYPLFSPQSLIAEGSANYGVEVVFPRAERIAFERDVLFPLAGLDSTRVEEYHRVLDLMKGLAFVGNEVARSYLNGEIDATEAAARLERYTLADPARAKKSLSFMTKYRSYVINYNYGQELVHDSIEARAKGDVDRRWAAFAELISSPRLPSALK